MKKFIISMSICTLASAVFFFYNSNNKHSLSELQIENLEALSANEGGDPGVKCYCVNGYVICSVRGQGGYCGGDPCDSHDRNCR